MPYDPQTLGLIPERIPPNERYWDHEAFKVYCQTRWPDIGRLELANRLDISKSTLNRVCSARGSLHLETYCRILAQARLPLETFLRLTSKA